MTRQEYNEYIQALQKRGYKFCGSWYNKPYYCKVIEYRKDEDGDSMAVCLLVFNLYETEDNCFGKTYYSIEPVVIVSRNIDERLDFTIDSPKRSVEEYERIAKEFMKFVDVYIDIK